MMPMDSMLPALIAHSGTGSDFRKVYSVKPKLVLPPLVDRFNSREVAPCSMASRQQSRKRSVVD